MNTFNTAIIDIGSNTIRLVIYSYSKEAGLHEISNVKKVARLRKHLQSDGNMSEEGINILKNTLISFKNMMKDFAVVNIKAVATAAIRQAENNEEILQRMKEETGIQIDLLSGEEEAYFGYLAVVYSMDIPSGITIDIGGGSTEITLFEQKKLKHSISFPFGTVSLKQSFVSGDKINVKEKNRLYQYVKKQFENLSWIRDSNLPIIGIGGSARNLAHIYQPIIEYPISGIHHYEMNGEALNKLSEYLERKSIDQMLQLEGLSSDRADIIEIALVVFQILMEIVNTNSFFISKSGLREGLIIHHVLESNEEAFHCERIFEQFSNQLAFKYGRSEEEVENLVSLTENLYLDSCKLHLLSYDVEHLELLKKAARVFSIGDYIEIDSSNQHTFYLLANQSIPGLNHKDRVKIALLASYKNRDYFRRLSKPFQSWFTREELKMLRQYGALIKFAYSLNISKRNVVKSIKMEVEGDYLVLYVYVKNRAMAEEYRAENQKKHIERLFKKKVMIEFINEGWNE
ncbi:Ppx/GppA family phosphatase [Ureibacillus thermophilus]|uniref:Ppx/GppA family phosphatase n=1 Tax=Ureibacillus thermophilus TaxID=367743 RepID=A0A4P6UTT0_9BACL|nr:Ppx/GppA family phosphatase [Ureibacillus thermophilus]QBK25466.1 Ppx/GppA family phosphatase [Ureibacillus thermophilus]